MDDYVRAYEAFEALALRLWCGDLPVQPGNLGDTDAWAARLPEDECAALNAMLGEAFGRRLDWDGDHPISKLVFAHHDGPGSPQWEAECEEFGCHE